MTSPTQPSRTSQSKMLPNELASLIHHIELNKSGWWQKSIERFIISAIWLAKTPLGTKEIADAIIEFGFQIDSNVLRPSLDRLAQSTVLIKFPNGTFKISEASLSQFEKEINEAAEVEKKAKLAFVELLSSHQISLSPDETWTQFNELFLQPMIRELGANTYKFLSGQNENTIQNQSEEFLKQFTAPIRQLMPKLLVEFLDPKNSAVRSYILRHLNAHFCVQASHLSKQALDKVTSINKADTNLTLFVDTNFLFSVLELHDNPADETALFLNELSQKMPANIKLKFYALPATLEESRDVIRRSIVDIQMTPNLAQAALSSRVTGIMKKFAEATILSGRRINAEEYFHDYLENTTLVIRSKKIELFNEDTEKYSTKQTVIDDIHEQQEFEAKHYANRAKPYNALKHDVILWHFVHEKRDRSLESPLDVRYWIVTLDLRLLGFDEHKRHKLREKYPVCMHPTTLVQLLQFWVPRTAQLEAALLGTIRLPFMLQEFDHDSERVTIRILNALSHYEEVSGLPKETIAQVLLDDAIRQKIRNEPDIQKQVEIVKDAIIADNARIREELECQKREADRILNEEIALKEMLRQTLQAEVDAVKASSMAMEGELSTALENSKAVIFDTQKNLADLRDTLDRERQDRHRREKEAEAALAAQATGIDVLKKQLAEIEAKQRSEQNEREQRYQRIKDVVRTGFGFLLIIMILPFWLFLVEKWSVRGLPLNALAVSVAMLAAGLACIFINRARVIGVIGTVLAVVLEVPQVPAWESQPKKDGVSDFRQPDMATSPDLRRPSPDIKPDSRQALPDL